MPQSQQFPVAEVLLAPAMPLHAGARVSLLGLSWLVVEAGDLEHSGGFGPVQARVIDECGVFTPRTIINTPWGQLEVIGRRQASRLLEKAQQSQAVAAPCEPAPVVEL